jgi:hypothetical protein
MRKSAVVLSLAAMSLNTLVGCGLDSTPVPPARGVVVEMDYDPATYKTRERCTTTPLTKKKSCTKVQVLKEKENWDITVRPDAGGDNQEIDVTKPIYDHCHIGAWFDGRVCVK